MGRHTEWHLQINLARLLDIFLPDDAFWTATDPVAASATAGCMRRRRGVKPGLPDVVILYRGKLITIELKSPNGQLRPSQRAAREQLLKAGVKAWWQCCSVEGAMWAIAKSGVKFRTIVHEDGSLESWEQPRLEPWEQPKRDSRERRPRPPVYWAPKVAVETETSEVVAARDEAA